MSPVFLDTGYLIALEASDDQHHREATRHWQNTGPTLTSIVTTTYVFDEVVTFFNSKGVIGKRSTSEIGSARARSSRSFPRPKRFSRLDGLGSRIVPTSAIP